MSRTVLAASLLLWCPALALAQEGEVSVTETQQDPVEAYNELTRAFNKAVNAWRQDAMKKVAEARKNNKPLPAIAMTPPTAKFIAQAQGLAKEHAGEDAAIQFHGFILKYASQEKDAVAMAVRTLTLDHAASSEIGEVLPYLEGAVRMGFKTEVMEFFGEVVDGNPSSEAKANALIARGSLMLANAGDDAERGAAQADLEKVAEVTKDADLIAEAAAALFEIKHLQIGCEAPEITAKDVHGVEFKLSDYRGKVVMLDFWGFW